MLVADLSHYDGADPEQHPAAFRLAERLRAIVRVGTLTPGGYRLDSALRCHRRPAHRVCGGYLVIARQEVPAEIIWRCSSCADGGAIRGWQQSPYDLRPPPALDDLALPLEMVDDELDLLRVIPSLDPGSEKVVYGAYRAEGRLWLTASIEELENLTSAVAAATNHQGHRRERRRLDQLLGRLEAELAEL